MVKCDGHWIGYISNVDSSILGLKLPNGFEIKYHTRDEAFEHLINLNKISNKMEFMWKFTTDFRCYNAKENRLYYITRSETLDLNFSENGDIQGIIIGETEEIYNNVIKKMFRLLRLFKDGDIRVPYSYIYYEYQGRLHSHTTRWTSLHVSDVKYHLEEEDYNELDNILNIPLPLTPSYLDLAFKNYERAYETHDTVLAFLALMISLEILYNPGRYELRYRISRNCAVLLGNSKDESDAIFKDIRSIYDIRSQIIHSGDIDKCNDRLVKSTRHYVRESIKKMIQLGESKEKILSKINTLGFGEIDSYDSE